MNPDTLIQRGNAGYSKQQKQLRDAKPVQAPVTPVTPAKQYNAGGGAINPYGTSPIVSPNAPITSATMAPVSPVALPAQIQPTAAAGMSGAIEASNKSVLTEQQKQDALVAEQSKIAETSQGSMDKALERMMGINTEASQAASTIDRTAEDAARQRSDDLVSQMEANSLAARRRVEELQKNNPQGLFGGALQDEINRINRDNEIQNADLAVQQLAALRSYERLNAIADRQLELKLEPLRLEAKNMELFYNANKDRFNKSDDRVFAAAKEKAEQEYKKAEAVETELLNVKKELFKNGAPADVIQAAQSATSVDELLVTPGISQYMQSPLEKLQMQKYAQDITKGGIDIAKARKELSKLMENTPAPGLTTSQREDLIKNPTAKQAQARIGVIKAVEDYGKKVSLYKEGLLTGSELRELNTALKTTVGSAINVAQGQGAMGEEEGKRILDNLEAGRLTREKKTLAAVKGVMEAQDSLLQTELQFIDSGIPGASDSFQLFADYKRSKTDPLLLNGASSGKDSLGLGI